MPATLPGGVIEATLEPFDVLNLETAGINADFTSSLIDADQPVVVFSGSEASDAPVFQTLAKRYCCADHLEQQLDPIRTAGKNFVLAHSPSRTQALKNAGALLGVAEAVERAELLVEEAGQVVDLVHVGDGPVGEGEDGAAGRQVGRREVRHARHVRGRSAPRR